MEILLCGCNGFAVAICREPDNPAKFDAGLARQRFIDKKSTGKVS
jgi:hypothetical protein